MKTKYILLSLLFVVFLSSCSEETNPTTPIADHFKANGLIIESMGQRILTYFNLKSPDTLIVPVGLTDHYEIKFLDADSNVIAPPTDADKKLGWVIGDTSMLEVYRHDGQEWEFHLKGKKVGTTDIEFRVMHIDHPDFKTIKLPVIVRDETLQHGLPIGIRAYFEEDNKLISESPLKDRTDLVKGQFSLKVGETTYHIEIQLFDEQNREFQPTAEHQLIIEFSNSGICEAIPAGEDEPWAFQLKGLSVGVTQIIFKIAGSDGTIHGEFQPIFVSVN